MKMREGADKAPASVSSQSGAVADVAAIARGLSAAMQRVVLAFPPEARQYLGIGWARSWTEIAFRAHCAHASIQACMDRGVVEGEEMRGQYEYRYLTPLGLAVRQHLEHGATAGVVGRKEA